MFTVRLRGGTLFSAYVANPANGWVDDLVALTLGLRNWGAGQVVGEELRQALYWECISCWTESMFILRGR